MIHPTWHCLQKTHMQRLCLFIALVAATVAHGAAIAACGQGSNGRNGVNLTVTVTSDATTGCYTQTFTSTRTQSLLVCNGTNANSCPVSVITTVSNPPGCATISGVGFVQFCNASKGAQRATGARGAKGPTGTTGPALTISTANQATNCSLIAGTGGFHLCNGTSDVPGATGLQGLQGPQGTNGTNGATGSQGSAGAVGSLPFIVVDGGTYALTQTGINAALVAAGAAGGGTVYVANTCSPPAACTGGNLKITSDCATPISIPLGVTLDLGGNTLAMHPTTACAPLVVLGATSDFAVQTVYFGGQPLTASSSEGSSTITVAAGIFTTDFVNAISDPTLLVSCSVASGFSGSQVSNAIIQRVMLVSADNTTGILRTRDPLAGSFAAGQLITCAAKGHISQALQNGIIDLNGNTAATSFGITVGGTEQRLSRLRITGTSSSTAFAIVRLSTCWDPIIEHVTFDTVTGASAMMRIDNTWGGFFHDIAIYNSGPGLSLISAGFNTFKDIVYLDAKSSTGIQLSTSPYNQFSNVRIDNPNNGVALGQTSCRNLFNGLYINGAGGHAVQTSSTGDSYNQFWGTVIRNSALSPVLINHVLSVGNYFDGEIQGTPTSVGGGLEPLLGNMYRGTVSGSNGLMVFTLHNATATAADFVGGREVIITVVNDVTVQFNVMGADNQIRTKQLTVS